MIPICGTTTSAGTARAIPTACAASKSRRRIVGVADAFDAMTSDRPYRPAVACRAPRSIEVGAKTFGTHFDPNCVYAFMRRG